MSAFVLATIPHPDPLPQPGPGWLLGFLLLLTFFLHILPMNFVLGGSIIGVVARGRGGEHRQKLVAWLTKAMPVAVAATVTTGVAPLLFLQVLYGRLFFSSAVLMGWYWLAVVLAVILAYYGTYLTAFRGAQLGRWETPVRWLSMLIFLGVGFLLTSNMTLMLRPAAFLEKYWAGRGSLNLDDPTLYPRFLHNVSGALAVAGIYVALYGLVRRKRDPEFGRWAVRHGGLWFVIATGLNMVVGFVQLVTLPRETMLRFMGQNMLATISLTLGLLLAIGALVMMLLAAQRPDPAPLVRGSVVCLALTLVSMVLMRDQVRQGALEAAAFEPQAWVVSQWLPIALFAVLLVGAIGTVIWMVAALARGSSSPGAEPPSV